MEQYIGYKDNPFPAHLSVGVVLFDKDTKEVLCHHFDDNSTGVIKRQVGLEDLYILMRETPHPDETVEQVIERGMMEEFGAQGKIVGYIGSIKSEFKGLGKVIEKTTIYFLVEKTSFDPGRRETNDAEASSRLEWHPADFLIEKMKEQQRRIERTDLDESFILERAKTYFSN